MSQNDRLLGLVGNAAFKVPCRVATTASITPSGEQTIDGVACVTGDRVLVKDQTDTTQNGILVVDTGTWERSKDCDGSYDLVKGSTIKVTDGSVNSGFWEITTENTIIVGTSALVFVRTLVNDSNSIGYIEDVTANDTTIQAKLRSMLIVSANRDFGAIGDDATDNAVALYEMRDFLRTITRPVVINFDPGTYRYSKNQWVKGIVDLTLNCEGSIFKCTSSGTGWDFDKYPFTGNQGVFNTSGYTTYDGAATTFGNLFNTAIASDATVIATTAADAANFALGNKVLIYGSGMQNASFPPNPRYFEWNEVVSAVAGTGVITLKNPLKNSYNSAWHDFVAGKGKPRILNLNRGDTNYTFGKRLVINGGYFAPNTVDLTKNVFQLEGYEQVILNGVKADSFVPTQCRMIECNNCDFAQAEFDKIISVLKVNGGRLKTISAGTGIERIELTGNVLLQGTNGLACRVLIIDGVIFDCLTNTGTSVAFGLDTGYTMDLIDFRSARFIIKDATVTALMNGGSETTFTLSSVSSNTKALVLCSTETAFEAVYQQLQEGYTYRLTDGSKQVKISKIYDEDATHAAIEGEWTVLPIAAEVYHGGNIQRVTGLEKVTQHGPYAPVKRFNFARLEHMAFGDEKGGILRYTELDVPRQASGVAATGIDILVRGKIRSVHLTVHRAYTGSDTNMALTVQARVPGVVSYVIANMLVAGPREANCFDTRWTDVLDVLLPTQDAYADTIRLFLAKGGGTYPVYADPVELPKFEIIIELIKP